MMQSLDNIFKSEPQSVHDMLCKNSGVGYYMPAYQRPYSWSKDNIKRFFEDISTVFNSLLKSDDSIIFLGALLMVDDNGEALAPRAEGQHPSQIKLVIDGQQRLTTLVLTITALHETMRKRYLALHKDLEVNPELENALGSILEQASGAINDTGLFTIKTHAPNEKYRYQPKITRSSAKEGKADCWGKNEKSALYRSPVAKYLFNLQSHLVNHPKLEANYKPLFVKDLIEKENDSSDMHIVLQNVIEMRKLIDKFAAGDLGNGISLSLNDLDSETLTHTTDFRLPKELLSCDSLSKETQELIFIVALSQFILHRVCLTYVTVNSESYAFDMFEALNTTGEPLTSFETFVPRVIRRLQDPTGELGEGRASEVEDLQSLEKRFEILAKNDQKIKLSTDLVITFSRLFSGAKMSRNLREQRDYLLRTYNECNSDEKALFLRAMRVSADYIVDCWSKRSYPCAVVPENDQRIAELCTYYLIDLKHNITQSVLIFFWLRELRESNGIQGGRSEFVDTLKALTAFSALWRAMTGGTGGIDSVYKGLPSAKEHLDSFDVMDLRKSLKEALVTKVTKIAKIDNEAKKNWVNIASKTPIGNSPEAIRKLLLLASQHNSVVSEGAVINENLGMSGIPWLEPNIWNALSQSCEIQLDQITDDKTKAAWDSSFTDPNASQLLGNFFIKAKNGIGAETLEAGSDWLSFKQELQTQAVSLERVERLLGSEQESDREKQFAAQAKHYYEELSYHEAWTKKEVEERTQEVLSRAWDTLIPWLND